MSSEEKKGVYVCCVSVMYGDYGDGSLWQCEQGYATEAEAKQAVYDHLCEDYLTPAELSEAVGSETNLDKKLDRLMRFADTQKLVMIYQIRFISVA